jgi:hypothetical protein
MLLHQRQEQPSSLPEAAATPLTILICAVDAKQDDDNKNQPHKVDRPSVCARFIIPCASSFAIPYFITAPDFFDTTTKNRRLDPRNAEAPQGQLGLGVKMK